LLTSGRSASAAESVLAAFQGQPDTRRFGAPTAGRTTVNSARRLAHGGAVSIATHASVDRTGLRIDGPMRPDVETGALRDPALEAARWVRSRCKSSAR
jgi:carboxyl-terminal processing protease